MKKITVTEKYALCMLKEFHHFSDDSELSDYLLMCMIVEMMLDKNLEIKDYNTKKPFELTNKIKIKLTNTAPKSEYNKEFYQIIMEMNKPEIAIDDLLAMICHGKSGFSDRNLRIITSVLEKNMQQDKLISFKNKKTIFGNKEVIVIDDNKFANIVEEIRSTILKKDTYSDDFILLISLLNATGFLKNLFIKYEKKTLKKKLEGINDNNISKYADIVKDIIDSYDGIVIT